ncbi:MAG TPA: hypothetical protein GXX15_04000 [Clostridia bacterium]|nr:hypothetical protein [Clostridia bacterium]
MYNISKKKISCGGVSYGKCIKKKSKKTLVMSCQKNERRERRRRGNTRNFE